MLFNLFKPKPDNNQLFTLSYTLSDHFRGYKRFPMVVQGNIESENNNAAFSGTKFSGHTITFNLCKSKDNLYYFDVLIDGRKVGAIFDQDHIKELRTNKITAVYAKNDIEKVATSDGFYERNRIHLFVKYKEG